MFRIFPCFRASITKPVLGLCLLGILFSSTVVAPPLLARSLHVIGPSYGGGTPGLSPDLGGDDDQPTMQPTSDRRMIAAVTEVGSHGSGARSLDRGLSFFTQVKTVLQKRSRALWASPFWTMLRLGR